GLRLKQAKAYFQQDQNSLQFWLDFLRRAGASNRINLEAVDSYIRQVEAEAHARRRMLYSLAKTAVWTLRHSRAARQGLVRFQQSRFASGIYGDLFDRYRPDMVVASTPGWRWDR